MLYLLHPTRPKLHIVFFVVCVKGENTVETIEAVLTKRPDLARATQSQRNGPKRRSVGVSRSRFDETQQKNRMLGTRGTVMANDPSSAAPVQGMAKISSHHSKKVAATQSVQERLPAFSSPFRPTLRSKTRHATLLSPFFFFHGPLLFLVGLYGFVESGHLDTHKG